MDVLKYPTMPQVTAEPYRSGERSYVVDTLLAAARLALESGDPNPDGSKAGAALAELYATAPA